MTICAQKRRNSPFLCVLCGFKRRTGWQKLAIGSAFQRIERRHGWVHNYAIIDGDRCYLPIPSSSGELRVPAAYAAFIELLARLSFGPIEYAGYLRRTGLKVAPLPWPPKMANGGRYATVASVVRIMEMRDWKKHQRESCPTCGRAFKSVQDYPRGRVLGFARLPMPEAVDRMSDGAAEKWLKRRRSDPDARRTPLDEGINMTPAIAEACETAEVRGYLRQL